MELSATDGSFGGPVRFLIFAITDDRRTKD